MKMDGEERVEKEAVSARMKANSKRGGVVVEDGVNEERGKL